MARAPDVKRRSGGDLDWVLGVIDYKLNRHFDAYRAAIARALERLWRSALRLPGLLRSARNDAEWSRLVTVGVRLTQGQLGFRHKVPQACPFIAAV